MISNKEIRRLITKDLHKERFPESLLPKVIGWISAEINNCADLFVLAGTFDEFVKIVFSIREYGIRVIQELI